MTSPRTLLLSIAATACGFIFTLVVVAGQASLAPTPAGGASMAPRIAETVAQDVRQVAPVAYTVALEPAAGSPQARGR